MGRQTLVGPTTDDYPHNSKAPETHCKCLGALSFETRMENKQFAKFEYFLNAIHYCIYLEQVWPSKKFEVIVRFLYKQMLIPLKREFG